jgi:hypothetical protein
LSFDDEEYIREIVSAKTLSSPGMYSVDNPNGLLIIIAHSNRCNALPFLDFEATFFIQNFELILSVQFNKIGEGFLHDSLLRDNQSEIAE